MENNITIDKEQKSRSLIVDPQYFGGYLNMARHNIFLISNDIATKIGESNFILKDNQEAQITESFLCDGDNDTINWNRVFSIGVRCLPILKMFDDEQNPLSEEGQMLNRSGKNFKELSAILKCLFKEITEFRNDYSHYFSTEWMQEITRKKVLSPEAAAFLTKAYRYAIAYTKKRFKDTLPDECYSIAENIVIVEEDVITEKGLVFFISMFLEREEAFRFIGKITGLKGTQYKEFLATRAVLLAFCIKLPHEKLSSENIKDALMLDMVNELNRCPALLYSVLKAEEKKQFLPVIAKPQQDNLIKNSSAEEVENYDDYIELLTKRIRHTNRFPGFALRYIDEMELFKTWRFHINLGKVKLFHYDKYFHGENTKREIIEDFKIFGRLADVGTADLVLDEINKTDDESIQFDMFYPRYHITQNKIGLKKEKWRSFIAPKLNTDSKIPYSIQPKPLSPDVFLSVHDLPKIILLEYIKPGETERIIDKFVAINNGLLMKKEFIEEVKAKLPKDWNVFQRRTNSPKEPGYKQQALDDLLYRKSILNTVLADNELNDKQIPTRILDYWLNIKDVDSHRNISERIKRMRLGCKNRIKALQNYRTHGSTNVPRVGEMATYLAKDIVDMVISETKKQAITSFAYNKLQECLAFYAVPEMKRLFIDIIRQALHLYEPDGHPFLNQIPWEELSFTAGVYEAYLEKKIVWIKETFYKTERDERNNRNITIVKIPSDVPIPLSIDKLTKQTDQSLDAWLASVHGKKTSSSGKKPIDLPTNIFDPAINECLKLNLHTKNISTPDENYRLLFRLWWEKYRCDSTQDFYKARREYVVYGEKVEFTNGEKQKYSEYYQDALNNVFAKQKKEREDEKKINRSLPAIQKRQIQTIFSRTIGKNEKEIRWTEEDDCVMLLMVKKLFEKYRTTSETLKLKDVHNLLNQEITIREPIQSTEARAAKIIDAHIPFKKFGALQRFTFDRRLPALSEYFSVDKIPAEQLKYELDLYNKVKEEILDQAFKLEKKILEKDTPGVVALSKKSTFPNIQHKPYLEWLKNKSLIDEPAYRFLGAVRNKFSHNQFPPKRDMDLCISSWKEKAYALQIKDEYIKLTTPIIQALE
jgi:hypothetical protein